jgi:hypothetical protein
MTLTASFAEGNYAAEFLVFEIPQYSRSGITVASGQNLTAGAVLGKVTKVLAAAPIPTIVGTGTGLMSALTFGPDVQTGSYVVELLATGATAAFSVTAPDGTLLHNGAVGTTYVSSHLSFLVSDGGTMTDGDTYTVVVTAAGTPVVIGGTGTGAMSAISLGPDAQNGGYRVVLKAAVGHGGDFDVIAPDGQIVERFLMGTTTGAAASFASRHISFTLTDATDFILGNYFNVIVAAGSGEAKAWAPTAVDGTQDVSGILFADVDATSEALAGVAVERFARVKHSTLAFAASVKTAHKERAYKQLAQLGIHAA